LAAGTGPLDTRRLPGRPFFATIDFAKEQHMSGMGPVGSVNAFHGVCGFTSSMTALYAQSPGTRGLLINGAPRVTRVLADIKTYLNMLKAANGRALLEEIADFNRVMYPQIVVQSGKTKPVWNGLDAFITRIDDCVTLLGKNTTMGEDNAVLNSLDPTFTLYMSPLAVKDYMERIWGATAVLSELPTGLSQNCIVGVTRPGPTNAHRNLVHWMYKNGSDIWSWGKKYNSVQGARSDYSVVYTIEVTLK
jgi:hypothetical protein